jgi:hypothetical protein
MGKEKRQNPCQIECMSEADSLNGALNRLIKEGLVEWNVSEKLSRIRTETEKDEKLLENYIDIELSIKEVTKYMYMLKELNTNVDWCLQMRKELMELRDLVFPKFCQKFPEYFSKDKS